MIVKNLKKSKFDKSIIFNKKILPWLFLLPSLLGVFIFKYYPVFRALFMGFFDWNITNPPGNFVGIDNYIAMFNASFFSDALINTLELWGLAMLCSFWVPIVQAIFLNEIRGKLQGALRVLYLLPIIVPGVSGIMLWRWIYNPEFGLANQILKVFHLPALQWLNSVDTVKLALSLPGLIGGATGVIIYLASIQSIPTEMYEAAALDGANFFARATRLTLPNMKGIIVINVILNLSSALQLFDGPYMMTGGGPAGSTTTLAIKIYNIAFAENRFGMAAAMSAFIFIVTMIIVSLYLKVQKSQN